MWDDWDSFAPEAGGFGGMESKPKQKMGYRSRPRMVRRTKPKLRLGKTVRSIKSSYRTFRPSLKQRARAMETKAKYLGRKQVAEDKLKVLVAEERRRAGIKAQERRQKIKTVLGKAKGMTKTVKKIKRNIERTGKPWKSSIYE